MTFSEDFIQRVAAADLGALQELDRRGIFCGDGEEAGAFAERLQALNRNIAAQEQALRQSGAFSVEDITVRAQDRIPAELFAEAHDITEALYGFRAEWVTGFFLDPRCSLLFGGCAYYFYPDFFALFIIRDSFRRRRRWLIYQRDELLAHELCHVGRVGLGSLRFEEIVAYQTASTTFRRATGGIFQGPQDTYLFLASTLLLLGGQMLRTFVWAALPGWPFWALLAAVAGWLGIRHLRLMRQFARAGQRLALAYGAVSARRLIFRCSDADVAALAACPSAAAVQAWVERRAEQSLRWSVSLSLFRQGGTEPSGAGG